jgi:hypothetical protein
MLTRTAVVGNAGFRPFCRAALAAFDPKRTFSHAVGRALPAEAVAVAELGYVFSRDNPLYAKLEAGL